MLKEELGFCTIFQMDADIAKIVFAQDAELEAGEIDLAHDVLTKWFTGPFMLLVDKINQYSYTFAAQLKLGEPEGMRAIAVVSHDFLGDNTHDYLVSLPTEKKLNMQNFNTEQAALQWLYSQRNVDYRND